MNDKLKKIWIDPVWSKVISWCIIGLLILLGRFFYYILEQLKIFNSFSHSLFLYVTTSIIIIIILGYFIFKYFTKKRNSIENERIIKLANIYSKILLFEELFLKEDMTNIVIRLRGHEIKAMTLIEQMRRDGMIDNINSNVPILSKVGKKVKAYILNYKR